MREEDGEAVPGTPGEQEPGAFFCKQRQSYLKLIRHDIHLPQERRFIYRTFYS